LKKIALGSDHAGFEMKEKLKDYLSQAGYAIEDCGAFSKDSVDYPVIALKVARLVADAVVEQGIIVDGAGIGSAMVANKVKGIRAALCYDQSTARNSREHNDANVLTLGAGLIGFELAKHIVDVWLNTNCTVDRHLKRVAMIDAIDRGERLDSQTSSNATKSAGVNAHGVTEAELAKIVEKVTAMLKLTPGSPVKSSCDNEPCNGCGQCADKIPETVREMIHVGASRISHSPGGAGSPQDIARYIDHTLLKPEASKDEINALCKEAAEYQFATVCINPTYVPLAYQILKHTSVKVCTVVGFPLGAHASEIKAQETRRAIREGAKEIDMVINIGALKSGDDDLVYRDIKAVVDACVDGYALCKVIIEAALLTDEEKIRACELSKKARAHFVKTSTGFAKGGATVHDVALMSSVVSGTSMGVKAAGGIRTLGDAEKMIAAGATRIGASAGVKIIQEAVKATN